MDWSSPAAAWAVLALVLIAAETIAPGAFLLWLGIAAAAVAVIVLAMPELPLLAQAAAFVVLSFVSIQVYRRRFRGRERGTDQPLLNRRAQQLVGRVVPLATDIRNGRGRVQIADALWDVQGDDLPAGTAVRVVAVEGMTLRVERA